MLRLERIGLKKTLALKSSSRFFLDRALLHALIGSCLIHIVLLTVFRVSSSDVSECPVLPQIEVQLESDSTVPIQVLTDSAKNRSTMQLTHVLDEAKSDLEYVNRTKNGLLEPSMHTPGDLITMLWSPEPDSVAHEFVSFKPPPQRIFPIKIHLSHALRECRIIRDGSELFKEKTQSCVEFQKNARYRLEYSVVVDALSGKIKSARKLRDCPEKRVQQTADQLIKTLRLWTPETKTYSGTLQISIYCSGDELQQVLRND